MSYRTCGQGGVWALGPRRHLSSCAGHRPYLCHPEWTRDSLSLPVLVCRCLCTFPSPSPSTCPASSPGWGGFAGSRPGRLATELREIVKVNPPSVPPFPRLRSGAVPPEPARPCQLQLWRGGWAGRHCRAVGSAGPSIIPLVKQPGALRPLRRWTCC